jgi:tryptophan synthase alpha chain
MADRRPGLVLFLNAGDPSFDVLERIVPALDEEGVDWLELAVPFPDSVTDGPTIHRSARRALDAGADLRSTLAFVARVRPRLRRLKLVLMADWRHTVRALEPDGFLGAVRGAGCDGLLLHGVPPRARPGYYARAHRAGVPLVATCYAGSSPATMAEAARNATAYLYLVSRFGTGEGSGPPDPALLAPVVGALRALTAAPIATGFGVRTAADVRAVGAAGSDAAIVGSASVACLERSLAAGRDPVADMRRFVAALRD